MPVLQANSNLQLTSRITDVADGSGQSARVLTFGLYAAVALALLIRAFVIWHWKWGLPDGDEAISGLMAKHIAEGRTLPVFFYGQAFFGALEAYLEAPLFLIFGFHANLLFLVPLLTSTLTVAVEFAFARDLFSRDVALASAFFIALAPLPFLQGGVKAAGGFGLAYLLELTAVWLFTRLYRHTPALTRDWIGFCLVSGLACWVWQIYIPLLALLVALLLRRRPDFPRRVWVMGAAAFFAASSPLWVYNVLHPGATFQQSFLRFTGVKPKFDPLTFVALLIQNRLWNRQSYLDAWLTGLAGRNWVLLAVLVAGIAAAVLTARRRGLISPAIWLPLLVAAAAFVIGHRQARYLYILPLLLIPCALAGWKYLAGPKWILAAVVVIVINAATVARAAFVASPAPLWQSAMGAIRSTNLHYGYTDFWNSYPLVYVTNEQLTLAPLLANEGRYRVARYPEYDRAVAEVPDAFLLLPDNSPDRRHVEELIAADDASVQHVRFANGTLYWPLRGQSPVRLWLRQVWQTDDEIGAARHEFGALWVKQP